MSTLAQLRTTLSSRFRDASFQVYTSAEYDSYLNDAYADIIGRHPYWPFLEQRSPLAVTAQAAGVALPTNASRVRSVYNVTDQIILTQYDGPDYRLDYPNLETSFGPPLEYRLLGTTLEVLPRPTVATNLSVEFYAGPASLAAGDTPIIPDPWQRLMVVGALALAYEDDGNLTQSSAHTARFEAGIQSMANDLLSSRTGRYPGIVDNW